MAERIDHQALPVWLRHIKLGSSGDAGARPVPSAGVPGGPRYFVPQAHDGINGRGGFTGGGFEERLGEEGRFTLGLPNGPGADGVLHRERFDVVTKGKRIAASGGAIYVAGIGGQYRPGDEWVEVYEGAPGSPGTLLFVGTPTAARVTRGRVDISGADGVFLTKKARETAAGFWVHAPRDVFEHYTEIWKTIASDDFASGTYTWATGQATSANGKWFYTRTENDPSGSAVRIRPGAVNTVGRMYATSGRGIGVGIGAADQHRVWRFEVAVRVNAIGGAGGDRGQVNVGMYETTLASERIYVRFFGDTIFYGTVDSAGTIEGSTQPPRPYPGVFRVAIEGRGNWVFFYVDGTLIGVLRMIEPFTLYPGVKAQTGTTETATSATVESALCWLTTPHGYVLGAPGDYHLPGLPTAGGLVGTYFDDRDLQQLGTRERIVLNPTRSPYARRLDPTVNFDGTPPTWQPTGPTNGDYFSARWTGAVYLDLATQDRFLAVSGDDSVRVWVGKTRLNEHLATAVGGASGLTGSMRTALFGAGSTAADWRSGWFPIVVEFFKGVGRGYAKLEWSLDNATWFIIPADKLSPVGIYDQQVRFESHYDQLRSIAETFGYQWSNEPRQLESGSFPGYLVPKVRVGVDTEKVIDSVQGSDLALDVNAEEVADVLLADAAGIADPKSGSQLTVQAINFGELESHLGVAMEYESLAEVSIAELGQQRSESLLILRGSPWEQVGVRPNRGHRELLDRFPLTGQLAEFGYRPGDAVRLDLPELGILDTAPRQILGVSRSFTPDGLGSPVLSFRQRPRGLQELIRSLKRTPLQQIRNYQGQLAIYPGSFAGDSTETAVFYADPYSRVALPPNLADVVEAWFVVHYVSPGAAAWSIEVNDTVRVTGITAQGRWDVLPWVARQQGTDPRMYARLAGGTLTVGYQLELKVRT